MGPTRCRGNLFSPTKFEDKNTPNYPRLFDLLPKIGGVLLLRLELRFDFFRAFYGIM